MNHSLIFKLEKETKGALRYAEVERDGRPVPVDSPQDSMLVGTLYLRKAGVAGTPKQLTVTVSY